MPSTLSGEYNESYKEKKVHETKKEIASMFSDAAVKRYNEEYQQDMEERRKKARNNVQYKRALANIGRMFASASITASEFERRRLAQEGDKSNLEQDHIDNAAGKVYDNIINDEDPMEKYKESDPNFYESVQKALGEVENYEDYQKQHSQQEDSFSYGDKF